MAHGLSSFTWKESILLAFSPKNVSLSLSLLFLLLGWHPRTRLGVTTTVRRGKIGEGGKLRLFFHRHFDHVDVQVGAPGRPTPHTCIARSHLSHHRDGSEAYPLCVLTRSLPDVRPAQECPWSTYRPL